MFAWPKVQEIRMDGSETRYVWRSATVCEEMKYRWEMLRSWRERREIARMLLDRLNDPQGTEKLLARHGISKGGI